MAPRLDDAVVARIQEELRVGGLKPSKLRIKQLATNFGCSIQTIYRHWKRIGCGLPPGGYKGGQRCVITFEMEVAIRNLIGKML